MVPFWKIISVMRGLAIMLVVLNHASVSMMVYYNNINDSKAVIENIPYMCVTLFLRNLTPICVPCFLTAAGFFAAKFIINFHSAKVASIKIGMRYVAWSFAVLSFLALKNKNFSVNDLICDLLFGRALPGYWFLVLLMQLYLLTPVLLKLAETIYLGFITVSIIQVFVSLLYYLDLDGKVFKFMENSPLFCNHLTFYYLGLFLSKNSEKCSLIIYKKRNLFLVWALFMLIFSIVESYLMGRKFCWDMSKCNIFAGQRFPQIFYCFFGIMYFFSAKFPKLKVIDAVECIGRYSLGILLMMDIFRYATYRILIKLADADWEFNYLVSLTVFFVAGIFFPLMVVKIVEICLGKKIKLLLFC